MCALRDIKRIRDVQEYTYTKNLVTPVDKVYIIYFTRIYN